MIKSTGRGLSVAYDYQGRPLVYVDYFKTNERVMIADIPRKGVTTVYSKVGDVLV